MLHLMHADKYLSTGIMKDWISPEPSATWTKGEPQALSKEQFLQSPPETKMWAHSSGHTQKRDGTVYCDW